MSSPSGPSIVATRNSSPSSPHSPTAGWPWRPSRSTMSLLTLPTSTIFAISTVSESRHAQAADELDRQVEPLHVARDLRPAAVDDDRVHADVLEQHDVAREVLAQRRVLHRRAAVLDHDRLAVELPDVRERLEQRPDVSSRRVLRVDPDVLVREVGEEHLGLGALAGQADDVLDLVAATARERARRAAPRRRPRRPARPRSRCRTAAARRPAARRRRPARRGPSSGRRRSARP